MKNTEEGGNLFIKGLLYAPSNMCSRHTDRDLGSC